MSSIIAIVILGAICAACIGALLVTRPPAAPRFRVDAEGTLDVVSDKVPE